ASVVAGGNWYRIDMPVPFKIDSIGFYASYISLGTNTTLITEETRPISQRTFDIIDGEWVVSRSNSNREPLIRAVVKIDQAVATVGVEEKAIEEVSLNVFPNPSSGILNVRFRQSEFGGGMLKIIDIHGRKVYGEIFGPLYEMDKTIDLRHLPAGAYFVQVVRNDGIIQKIWMKGE
ncbi:MAG: T9SS type A sorting domain-containing protein, partial [Bacteroidetes bacterium]|nr:T9SS type A sorting domain-containing protein [Bacteroidota bacterium]